MNYKQFTAQLVLTTACNLGCKYCYMNNTNENMSIDNMNYIVKNIPKIMKKYGCNSYSVSYFGGEPLINWEIIEKFDGVFKSDSRCSFRVIISNGLLLDKHKVDFIKKNNIGFSWSFDGLGNVNNRVDLGGNSTIERYKAKLDIIKEVSPYGCKIMVDPNSVSNMLTNYKYLINEFDLINLDFSLVRDNVWSESDIALFDDKLSILANYYISDVKYKSVGENIPTIGFFMLSLADMLVNTKFGKRSFSCFAGNSGLGFMPNGKAYACARFGSNDSYPIYDYIKDELVELNFDYLYDENIYNPKTYKKCNGCEIYKYCNGACIYNFINNNDEPLTNICKLYKIIYRESLKVYNSLKDNKNFIDILERCMANNG